MKKLAISLFNVILAFSAFHLNAEQSNSQTNNTSVNSGKAATLQDIGWCDTYTDAMKKVHSTGKPLLILFTGTGWCPACMKLEKEVLKKPEFIQAVADNFVFYKAEFTDPSPDGLNNTPDSVLLDRYQITVFPTIVAVDGFGRQLFNMNYKPGGPATYARELNQKLLATQQKR